MPTMNDYERRFQRSLQKLTVPSWYIDSNHSTSSKQSLTSTTLSIPWKNQNLDIERTPEIVHIRRPFSYRSCRSSLTTSPSPSIHSWHPNHLNDGTNLSVYGPSRSTSASTRRNSKYQKGIDRVTKSSRWYKPTVFTSNNNNASTKDQTVIEKNPIHYDTPKTSSHHVETMVNEKQQNEIVESSIMPLANENEESIDEFERTANDLVESILTEILTCENLDEFDDQNSGVRELSDDENGLRELDENDINNTDEFILFATQPETFDDEPRINQNKLYTFAKLQEQTVSNDVETTNTSSEQIFFTSPIYQKDNQTNIKCPSIEGINEETARIGRLLLNQIPISLFENLRHLSSNRTQIHHFEHEDYYKSPTINECDEDVISDNNHPDSAYSSNQERIHLAQSIYEPLSECYSGYSYAHNDFLATNLSSIQTTTDEAYESEPTTMCSSIATTTHVHPDLEHEFEYPSPPPPVPDRRLKPSHLKPQSTKQQENSDTTEYSIVQKDKIIPIKAIQNLLNSTCDDSISPSTRSMSSRHYCGSIPVANENRQSTTVNHSEQQKEKKRHGRTLSCLHPSTTDDNKRQNSFNKIKSKKHKIKNEFDEATNGLAIRLPAPHAKPSPKRANSMTTSNRPSHYETSV